MKYFYLCGIFCISLLISGCRNEAAIAARKKLRESQTPFSQSAFIKAIADGDSEKVALFLTGGIDTGIGQHNSNALLTAVEHNRFDIVKKLIENGAAIDPDGYGGTPLCVASTKGYKDIAKFLINKGACVDYLRGSINPLILASASGHTEIVELLINAGANVNIQGEYTSFTPLMLAARNGHKDVVKALLSKKGNIFLLKKATHTKSTNYGGKTALDFATFKGHDEVANLIIDDSRFKAPAADNALAIAIAVNRKPIIEKLISIGVDMNADYGSMPLLSWAILNQHLAGAKILIESGAETNKEDQLEMIPLDYALTAKVKINKAAQQATAEWEAILKQKIDQTKKNINDKNVQDDPVIEKAQVLKQAKDREYAEITEIITLLRSKNQAKTAKK